MNKDDKNKDKEEKFNLEKIAPKLKLLRKTFRFDRQSDLDDHLRFPKGSIHRIESGKGANSDNLVTLLRFFYENNINLNWIFDSKDKEQLALLSTTSSNIDNVGTPNINTEEIDLIIDVLTKYKGGQLNKTEEDTHIK